MAVHSGYDLFFFDLDDTLLDFRESERLSFDRALRGLGLSEGLPELFKRYQTENLALWRDLERGATTQALLKVERFRRSFAAHGIALDPELASARYLDELPEAVVLIDHAVEICEWLSHRGEIGIITNGIQSVQARRIQNSALAPFISFVAVSESSGYAKPDVRFFEYAAKLARKFAPASSLMVGDRFEADIVGAQAFGIDCCWYNPGRQTRPRHSPPQYEIGHLSELRPLLEARD
jgi:YjjG family noncanonical pyrimidine nucleotidase